MLLAIDAGNTNTVFAIYQGDEQRGQWRAETRAGRTADEYAVWLNQLLDHEAIDGRGIGAAIIASVVPETVFHLSGLCQDYYGCQPLIVGENVHIGAELAVDNPHEVGADRVVNAVAAHSRYPGALIVIDFGTATTFDVVDASGAYRGGVISPGINLSLEALHMAAAQLPRIAPKRPQAVIGTGTISAMQSGVYWGYVGLIEGLVARIREEFAEPMTVIATGGLAPLFHAATAVIEHIDPDLTMRGLFEVYRRNTENGS
ncbi:MAG: type III pantothenate kinase [Proteobacteria bacterium]|nr:type III pantothenate kinase [Pseudomonadota bacterium]